MFASRIVNRVSILLRATKRVSALARMPFGDENIAVPFFRLGRNIQQVGGYRGPNLLIVDEPRLTPLRIDHAVGVSNGTSVLASVSTFNIKAAPSQH